jgi:flagellar hook-basal body complex protein FliE
MMISSISGVGFAQGPAATAKVGAGQAAGGADFSKVLADVASSAVDALKGGEAAALGGINGTRSVQDVVQNIMNAEQALQTALAVRDKLVAAYTEITRMAI